MKRIALFVLGLLSVQAVAQNINPGADEIYREDEIAFIYLTMDSADSIALLDDIDIYSDEYLPTAFRFKNSLMDTTLEFNVGIRLRGNTSRGQPKRSLKIKFKEFDGSKFYGYKKFNLKAENNDPSMAREMLTLQTFRNANVPATRTQYAEVYINGGYMGLYLNVEQLDDEFVDSRFGNEDGNLYKCEYGATLEDDGQIYNNDIYELETNEDENNRSILEHFVDVLNNTPDEDFKTEIEKIFNVQPFLRYLAVEALVGHWDGYSYNQNNFYLYANPDNGLIEFMPYDVDNTFGMDWVGRDWGTRDVLDWPKHDQPRPLTKRILAIDSYFYQYTEELKNLLETYFTETALFPEMDDLKEMISDAIERDPYFPLTFGFTHQDFLDSYTVALGGDYGQLPYGLKPYVTIRSEIAAQNLEILGVQHSLGSKISVYPNPSDGNGIEVKSEQAFNSVVIRDVLGHLIDFQINKISARHYSIEFSLLPGIYVLTIDAKSHNFLVSN